MITIRSPSGKVDEARTAELFLSLTKDTPRWVGVGYKRRATDIRPSFEAITHIPRPRFPLIISYRSPLIHDEWENELATHPNTVATLMLLDTIRNGANLGFSGPRDQFARHNNHSSSAEDPTAVDSYYSGEQAAGRVRTWYGSPPSRIASYSRSGWYRKQEMGSVSAHA